MRTAVRLPDPEASVEPLPALLARVADAGFEGVAFATLAERHLRPVAAALGETGLEPVAVGVAHDRLQAERRRVERDLATVGCERVVLPGLHEAHFADESAVTRMATRLSALGGRLAAAGRTLCYRNGSHEFRSVERPGDEPTGDPAVEDVTTDDAAANGAAADDTAADDGAATAADRKPDAYDLLVARSGDGLAFELDVGGVVAAGRDPVAVLAQLDGRVPLVQVRDVGPDGEPGGGTVDVAAIGAAARGAGTEWLVYGGSGHSGRSLARAGEVLARALE